LAEVTGAGASAGAVDTTGSTAGASSATSFAAAFLAGAFFATAFFAAAFFAGLASPSSVVFAAAFFAAFLTGFGSSGCTSRFKPSRSARERTRSACCSMMVDDCVFTPMPNLLHKSSVS
jgi:hypothetical protein